ncbi:MAG: hypothetical protein ACRCVT_10120 [Leadbetterella sp.]
MKKNILLALVLGSEKKAQMIEYISKNPGATIPEIAEQVAVFENYVSLVSRDLQMLDLIDKQQVRGTKKLEYFLTEKAENLLKILPKGYVNFFKIFNSEIRFKLLFALDRLKTASIKELLEMIDYPESSTSKIFSAAEKSGVIEKIYNQQGDQRFIHLQIMESYKPLIEWLRNHK